MFRVCYPVKDCALGIAAREFAMVTLGYPQSPRIHASPAATALIRALQCKVSPLVCMLAKYAPVRGTSGAPVTRLEYFEIQYSNADDIFNFEPNDGAQIAHDACENADKMGSARVVVRL